jgi:hypothetical protein
MNVTLRRFGVESDSEAVGSAPLLPAGHCSFMTAFRRFLPEDATGA